MASSWGLSWGTSWGVSWGDTGVVAPTLRSVPDWEDAFRDKRRKIRGLEKANELVRKLNAQKEREDAKARALEAKIAAANAAEAQTAKTRAAIAKAAASHEKSLARAAAIEKKIVEARMALERERQIREWIEIDEEEAELLLLQ